MNRASRGTGVVLAALAMCLTLVLAASPANAAFQRESFSTFQQQLNAGQIQSATFNKKAHTLHLTLNDGRLVLISYPSHEEPQLAALLRAKGVPVTVEKKKKAAKAVHHTLRYIAGAIVVVVIVVVVAVLLIDRRRKLGEETAEPSASDPAAEPTAEP
jgi:ATP-dependent Zn protease